MTWKHEKHVFRTMALLPEFRYEAPRGERAVIHVMASRGGF